MFVFKEFALFAKLFWMTVYRVASVRGSIFDEGEITIPPLFSASLCDLVELLLSFLEAVNVCLPFKND